MSKESESIKAKGDELIEKFVHLARGDRESTKQKRATRCAIIAVEEIIKVIDDDKRFLLDWEKEAVEYWNNVINYLKSKL